MNESKRFSPSRLVIARERRGMSQSSLATAIGITKDAISKIESGSIYNPTQENVYKMSFSLGFPIGWFYQTELEPFIAEDLTFRARRKMTASVRNQAVRATDLAASVISPSLRSRFKLPACDIPDLSGHDPEEAAAILRSTWGLGQAPIHSMVHLLEKHGIEVFWVSEPSEHLDAWSIRRGNVACIMLNTFKSAGEREQFDAAHELGHLVLHNSVDVIFDGEEPIGRKLESEANQFAGAFLLPRDQFKMEVPKYPSLYSYFPLKERWHVSVAAMLMRSRTIGAIGDRTFTSLYKDLSAKGWRKKEPAELKRSTSKLHQLAFEKLAQKNVFPSTFAKSIELPLSDLHELVPVTPTLEDFELNRPKDQHFGHLRLVD